MLPYKKNHFNNNNAGYKNCLGGPIELVQYRLPLKQNKYLKEVDISEHLADFATTVYAFNEDVKNYCGVY